MTTITATPDPDTASVVLLVTPTATVTSLLRSDANGTHPVRTLAGVLPITGPVVVTDYEASLAGTITYTTSGATPAAGAAVTTALDLDQQWLMVPVVPQWSLQVDAAPPARNPGVLDFTGQRTSASTVHQVIGRADPLVALGPLLLRTGTLEVWCAGLAQARTLEAAYDRGEVVLLRQQVPGLDLYHVATQTAIAADPALTVPRRWHLTVTYAEVDWPPGDQVGTLGWSIDDVTATYATVSVVALTYATINDLTVGPDL